MSNDDGDVHLESSGAGSEIVLKSQKVRVDGDVYCYDGDVGISQRVDGLAVKDTALSERIDALNATDAELKKTDTALSGRIEALMPPKCIPTGGKVFQFNSTNWQCVREPSWSCRYAESSTESSPTPWTKHQTLTASAGSAGDYLCTLVFIPEKCAVLGVFATAAAATNKGSNSGSAHVFASSKHRIPYTSIALRGGWKV